MLAGCGIPGIGSIEVSLFSFVDGERSPTPTTFEHVDRALAAADRVHKEGIWANVTLRERIEVLAKVPPFLAEVEERMATADALETGVPLPLTRMINGSLKQAFSMEALTGVGDLVRPRDLRTIHGKLCQARKPLGPAIVMAPWNVPSGTVVPKVLAALLVGCPVIVKPSGWAATALQHCLGALQAAGLPSGVLQWLHGGPDIGERLVSDPRLGAVHFTGSADTGRLIARSCAQNLVRSAMECGGSNAAIVLEDADLDATAAAIYSGMTLLNGQWCAGVSRILAHDKVASQLTERLLGHFSTAKLGPATNEDTEIGPLSHASHFDKVKGQLEGFLARGGRARWLTEEATGERARALGRCVSTLHDVRQPLQGNFFPPALVEGLEGDADAGEIFGPLAVLYTFEADDHAIRAANLQPMLQSYIFSGDPERAMRLGSGLCCGSVMINGIGFGWELEEGVEEPAAAFFAGSGLGEEAGLPGLMRLFAGPQNIGVNGSA